MLASTLKGGKDVIFSCCPDVVNMEQVCSMEVNLGENQQKRHEEPGSPKPGNRVFSMVRVAI